MCGTGTQGSWTAIRNEGRDGKPMPQWSMGRVALVGDAAHSTSPYAAYGAGMARTSEATVY
jgi:2-polyprenyl-6-methoxyphenol hydroxylase-like FAD-dependent oxidoreductase